MCVTLDLLPGEAQHLTKILELKLSDVDSAYNGSWVADCDLEILIANPWTRISNDSYTESITSTAFNYQYVYIANTTGEISI